MWVCGNDYTETDVWRKVSGASVSSLESTQQSLIDDNEFITATGSMVGSIYNYLP